MEEDELPNSGPGSGTGGYTHLGFPTSCTAELLPGIGTALCASAWFESCPCEAPVGSPHFWGAPAAENRCPQPAEHHSGSQTHVVQVFGSDPQKCPGRAAEWGRKCHCAPFLELLDLLDAVQTGIRQPELRFTFSLTLYIAGVAQQMLKPEEHMYIKVNRFLLSHQYLDLRKVPDFFQLFYSFDFEYKTEREWILRVLGEGLHDKHCYELYDYQRIFQIILSFFNSPLCDGGSQCRILEILQSAARVTRAADELIQDHSLLTWLLHSLEERCTYTKNLFCMECPGKFRQVHPKHTRRWSPVGDGPAAGEDLTSKCDFLSCLCACLGLFICFWVFFRFLETQVINKIISLLHALWLTNLGDKKKTRLSSRRRGNFFPFSL